MKQKVDKNSQERFTVESNEWEHGIQALLK